MHWYSWSKTVWVVAWCGLILPTWPTAAQEGAAGKEPLTREEFLKFLEEYRQFQTHYASMKEENEKLRQELAEIKASIDGQSSLGKHSDLEEKLARERTAIIETLREELRDTTEPLLPGATNFVLGGAAVTLYQDRETVDSTFGLGVAPILLWKPTDKLLFEAELGLSLSREETEVELGLAHISYLLNDYVTIGGGLFRLPFLTFWERWHPSWINKVATIPLIYERGLIGPAGLGVQVRGGAKIGPTKLNYALYYVNGPNFETSQVAAGRLGTNNFRDNNNNKGFGGRIGFLPLPEWELGYSFFTGRVGDSGSDFSRIDAVMHGVDLSYTREIEAIKGRLDLRAEAVWIDTDDAIFTGPFNPFTFDNKRSGWFVQAAYRPTRTDVQLGDFELKNLEFVLRYDQLRESGPGDLGLDHDQLTIGLDYWIRPNVVMKLAYTFDDAHGGDDLDGFFLQMAVGF